MRTRLILGIVALLGATVSMQATTITASLAGTISSAESTDTLGIFAPAGTNLASDAFSASYSHNTVDFGSVISCGTNCTYYNSTYSTRASSTAISVTINGVTKSYTPSADGQVEFQNSFPGYNANFFSDSVDAADQGLNGVIVSIGSVNPVAFGQSVTPSQSFTNDFEFYTASGGMEAIEFVPTPAAAVPEPRSIGLIGVGLSLIVLSQSRRIARRLRSNVYR